MTAPRADAKLSLFMTAPTAALLDDLVALARRAGAAILAARAENASASARTKPDGSPVTPADLAAQTLILDGLRTLAPGTAVIAEETAAGERPAAVENDFWLVDPLDGTREFLAGRDEYTVNIAWIAGGRPRLGVVHAPASDLAYLASVGEGAWKEEAGARRALACRAVPATGPRVLASRSHADPEPLHRFLALHPGATLEVLGSSLKFCRIAEGAADLYPRHGGTMEWDTAAGQAVLEAAGGRVLTLAGEPLRYGKPGFVNPGFVARGA